MERKSILIAPHLLILIHPDLTRAYFWPTVNKGPTCLWSGYFLTHADEIFFDGEKLKNLGFFGEIVHTKRRLTRPNPSKKNDPKRVKMCRPGPSLPCMSIFWQHWINSMRANCLLPVLIITLQLNEIKILLKEVIMVHPLFKNLIWWDIPSDILKVFLSSKPHW